MKFYSMIFILVGFVAFAAIPPGFKEQMPSSGISPVLGSDFGKSSLDINQTEVLMVKTLNGTCAIPLTEEFVSASGVDADELYGFVQEDKDYSRFQQKRKNIGFLHDFREVKPVPLCSLAQSEKVLLSLFDDPVQVALEPATIAIVSAVAYYGVCSFIQAKIDSGVLVGISEISSFMSFMGVMSTICLPVTVGVNMPLRLIIKGDLKNNTPYN